MSVILQKTKSKWFVAITFLLLFLAGILFGKIGYSKVLNGDFCARCGARRDSKALDFHIFKLRMPFGYSTKTTPSVLTATWDKYAGGCTHDWVFSYQDRFSFFQKSYLDGFPGFDCPVAMQPEQLAEAVQLLDVPGARVVALNAIGDRKNFLRFVAAEQLRTFGASNNSGRVLFKPTEWWLAHSNCFILYTNKADTAVVLNSLDSTEDSQLAYAVEKTHELLRQP